MASSPEGTRQTMNCPLVCWSTWLLCWRLVGFQSNLPSGFGESSIFNMIPNLTFQSTILGSSSASRIICGFTLGTLSVASLDGFLGAVTVVGQYPGPVSTPSLRAMRTTSNSFISVIMKGFVFFFCAPEPMPLVSLWSSHKALCQTPVLARTSLRLGPKLPEKY